MSESLAERVEDMFQRIGPGIALFNLLMVEDAYEACRRQPPEQPGQVFPMLVSATVLGQRESLDAAYADLIEYETVLRSTLALAHVVGQPQGTRSVPNPLGLDGEGRALMTWLRALHFMRDRMDGDATELAEWCVLAETERAQIASPKARASALDAIQAAAARAFESF